MKLPKYELKKAAYSRLTIGANKISYQVYDHIPINKKPPYVAFGEIHTFPWNEKGSAGTDNDFDFHFWDIAGSDKNINDMMGDVLDSITVTDGDASSSVLTLTNHTVISQFLENSFIALEDDNRTRHGVMVMKFLIEQN